MKFIFLLSFKYHFLYKLSFKINDRKDILIKEGSLLKSFKKIEKILFFRRNVIQI